jgi:homogentisate 1,2-dioxygenase
MQGSSSENTVIKAGNVYGTAFTVARQKNRGYWLWAGEANLMSAISSTLRAGRHRQLVAHAPVMTITTPHFQP